MNWQQLLSPIRLGMEDYHDKKRYDNRNQFQRDYDRLIFSSSFRRLQNKTQVFPLPGSIFVHNRLTHSLEVASVGRSLGMNISQNSKYCANTDFMSEIGAIVSTACLAHDMGNPPFGHSGEKAIATFFSEGKGKSLQKHMSDAEWNDFIRFDGNANAFRLLTHQFKGKRKGGFVLTYSTLASIVKYPYSSMFSDPKKQKFGFFNSEKMDYLKIAETLGITPTLKDKNKFVRHPLVYLVEAADDICYQIMDIEDAHKLKIISTEETKALLMSFFDDKGKARIEKNINIVDDVNEQIAYLRSSVIGLLISSCSTIFIENEKDILDGNFESSLIKKMPTPLISAYLECSKKAVNEIYSSEEVLDVEIAGYKIIQTLLDTFVSAVLEPDKAYSQQLIKRIPAQYEIDSHTVYGKVQAIVDYISGMTDVYALDLYRKLTGMSISTV